MATAALPLLSACAAPGAQTTTDPSRTAKPVTLRYMSKHAANSVGFEKDEEQFRAFKQDYPHITVELNPAPSPVKEKFIVEASSGAPPHLVQNDWGVWMDLARGGSIQDLSPFFKRDKLSPETLFVPRAIEQYSDRGALYGFPISVSSDSFAYNKDLFDREGLKPPPTDTKDKRWTMEAFLEVAQKLTKAGQQVGMMNTHAYWANRGTWYGRASWDDVTKQAFLNHPDHMKGQQFWVDLLHKYRVIPTSDEAKQLAGGASNAFLAGKAAMMYTCCPHGLKDAPFTWGLATLPYSGPTGSNNISGRIYPHGLHVAKQLPTAEVEAVWTLFKWYMAKPEHGGLMPPSNSHIVAPYKDPRYSAIAQKEFETLTGGVSGKAPLLTAQHAFPSASGMLKYVEYTDVWEQVKPLWTQVEANQIAVRDYANQAQKIIEQAKLGRT